MDRSHLPGIVITMKTALTLRFVMIGLSVVLGIALLAKGDTLIGVILIALALVRAAMVFSRLRRRNELVQRGQLRRRGDAANWRSR